MIAVADELQQILGQQNAEDLVLVFAVHGEAGVARFDHGGENIGQRRFGRHHHDLRARDHDVVHAELGNLDGTLDHGQGVVGHQAIGLGGAQLFDELLAVARLAGKQVAQSIPPTAVGRAAGTARVLVHYSYGCCPMAGGKVSLAENP